jgi:RNA polymerase sigma factor (sigma-70 family)
MAGLSKEQEQELAEKIQAGDLRARDELILANDGLANMAAWKAMKLFNPRTLTFDDLKQVALLDMLTTAKYFKPGKGRFSTLAVHCMNRALRVACNKANHQLSGAWQMQYDQATGRRAKTKRLQKIIDEFKPPELCDVETAYGLAAEIDNRQEQLDHLQTAMSRLSAENRKILEMRHIQGMQISAIGKAFGWCESMTAQRLRRALKQLKALMEADL